MGKDELLKYVDEIEKKLDGESECWQDGELYKLIEIVRELEQEVRMLEHTNDILDERLNEGY